VIRMNKLAWIGAALSLLGLMTGCGNKSKPTEPGVAEPDAAPTRDARLSLFSPLPRTMELAGNPMTPAEIELGRRLFYDERLSKNQDIACNTCHLLDNHGVDGLSTSKGHKGQIGGRNAPTVYNAAGHIAQFWDGRAPDVEDQAKGPPLNPIEMAMVDEAAIVAVLKSIPGYVSLFSVAFAEDRDPVTFDNMARAIGAFERGLVTPSRFDEYLAGNDAALSGEEKAGLTAFLDAGCGGCHSGAYVGGGMYQKLGLLKSWDKDADQGRFDVTGDEADRQVFKVPSLRNIAETGPYFHNGSVATLDEAVRLMAEHQTGVAVDDAQVDSILVFLAALSGKVDTGYSARPELPESSAMTPAPDPG